MTTDSHWTWTILMEHGQSYHCPDSVTIHRLLELYRAAGFQFAEIEAIIRH